MKTMKLTQILLAFVALVTIASCVNDDDFSVPDLVGTEPVFEEGQVTTVTALKNLFLQEGETVDLSDSTQYVEGYVISSDEEGNWFEEIIIQNSPTDPTAGLRILIDESPLFTYYEVGRKIYVKLEGLHLGESNGVLTLGVTENFEKIPAASQFDYIERSTVVETIVPVETTIADFSEDLENIFIQLTDVQFAKGEVVDQSFTYAGEASDEFDGERTIFSCSTDQTAIVSTSTFASFKSVLLPTGRGTITGVLTRNFFGDTFNIVINDLSNIMLDSEERCDPIVLECTGTSGGANTVFQENFDDVETISDLENMGWINQNVTGGNLEYRTGSFSGNQYAQISGFSSGENPFDVWLVTPEIDLAGSTEEQLTFDIQANYDNGTILSAFITDNYTGDILTTTWTQLDVNVPSGPSGGFGNFEAVNPVNISCVEGTVRIAFRYQGSDPGPTTRYHIDNIEISGN